jgi:hypothetical protein
MLDHSRESGNPGLPWLEQGAKSSTAALAPRFREDDE